MPLKMGRHLIRRTEAANTSKRKIKLGEMIRGSRTAITREKEVFHV
jgi:hypothetical protein